MLTREFLLSLFHYNKDNGTLIWKNPSKFQSKLLGTVAGTIQYHKHNNYKFVKILGKPRLLHRLIWTIEYNIEPNIIDHIDGDSLNNHISNLRNTTSSENNYNRKVHRKGQLRGCTQDKRTGDWSAQGKVNGRQKYLGSFKTQEEAHAKFLEVTRGI